MGLIRFIQERIFQSEPPVPAKRTGFAPEPEPINHDPMAEGQYRPPSWTTKPDDQESGRDNA